MIKRSLLICGFIIFCSFVGMAQNEMVFWLKTMDGWSGLHDSLLFGNNALATFGRDSTLGEFPCPPGEPGFRNYFVCPRNPSPADWGLGFCNVDLRDTNDASVRKDSFYVITINDFGPDSTNVTLKWPDSAWITARCDSMKLVVRYDTLLPADGLNMASTNTLLLLRPYDLNGWNLSAPVIKLRIFKWGLHQPNIDAVRKESPVIPKTFSLSQNFPRPFNPTTTIQFTLPHESHVTLKVYNLLGQEVQTLVNETRRSGIYGVDFDAAKLSSGIYFYTILAEAITSGQAGDFVQTKKMVVLK